MSVQLLPKPPRWTSPAYLDPVSRFCVPLAYVVGVVLVAIGAIPSDPSVNLLIPGGAPGLAPGV